MMRTVVVLDPVGRVLKSYVIDLADDLVEGEDAFIIAARRLAHKDRLDSANERLRYVIAPQPEGRA